MSEGMRAVTFKTDIFRTNRDLKRGEYALSQFLRTLFLLDCAYLRDYPDTPALYTAGVIYRREGLGLESWKTIPRVMADGYGDCEDLACWRAAELNAKGVKARVVFTKKIIANRFRLFHILVRLPNGTLEDPSKILGMKGDG